MRARFDPSTLYEHEILRGREAHAVGKEDALEQHAHPSRPWAVFQQPTRGAAVCECELGPDHRVVVALAAERVAAPAPRQRILRDGRREVDLAGTFANCHVVGIREARAIWQRIRQHCGVLAVEA